MQTQFWHDTWEDARDADINALGGRKKLAARLWPADDEETRQSRIKACCAPGHKQEFKPSEVIAIKRWARESASTAMIDFEAHELHFRVEWVEPEDEKARLQREFIEAVDRLDRIKNDIARNDLNVVNFSRR